jgi:Protein of unknown function (DUF2630)
LDEKRILGVIHELVAEEHGLRAKRLAGELSTDEEQARLREVEVALDQCWDLLRRRRAAREFGENPDAVAPRSPAEVEGYLQ